MLDAIDADRGKKRVASSPPKAFSFMEDIGSCLVKEGPSVSLGRDVRLVSQNVIGSALSVDNEIIHLTAFLRNGKDGIDRDMDNDGVWDSDKDGIDRDLDNDGTWDYKRGGIDRDLDNDGVWDFDSGGIDRDVDVPF